MSMIWSMERYVNYLWNRNSEDFWGKRGACGISNAHNKSYKLLSSNRKKHNLSNSTPQIDRDAWFRAEESPWNTIINSRLYFFREGSFSSVSNELTFKIQLHTKSSSIRSLCNLSLLIFLSTKRKCLPRDISSEVLSILREHVVTVSAKVS